MFENIGCPGNPLDQLGLQADACNRRAAVEADAIRRAAAEAATIGEQQLNWTRSGAAVEADAIGEQQLCAESVVSGAGITHDRRTRGK